MFPVNSPDNRSANQVNARAAAVHEGALLPHTAKSENVCASVNEYISYFKVVSTKHTVANQTNYAVISAGPLCILLI